MDARAHLSRRDIPGWFGKLPGMGDFAQRRLPEQFRAVWDSWLQTGLFDLRNRQPDWVERYLAGPIWFFALGPQLAGPMPWLGVMMPSVDSAGRYFPLTLAIELGDRQTAERERSQAWARQWWEMSAQAALAALESDLDASRFEASLNEAFGGEADSTQPTGPRVHLPAQYQSIWRTDPGDDSPPNLVVTGLPTAGSFDALFGHGADISHAAEISR
ncbi:type VI secretion system-associated protein TagF [Rhodoferax sp.]|uniref:type VI secretion system-associated protein TagF n=1 Tax=Rhodoferax sp. TaxID=50421 RepID=UPI0039B952C7